MKSPKDLDIDSSIRVNKIGHTLIDRASFLRSSKEKVSTIRIHKPQQHAQVVMLDHSQQISASRLDFNDSPSSSLLPHLSFIQKYPVDKAKLQPLSSKRKIMPALPELKDDLLMEKLNNTIDVAPQIIKIKAP